MSDLANRYFEKALERVRAQDYDQSVKLLAEAIKLKPDFVEAWVVRGNIRLMEQQPLDAALHFDRAISFNERAHDAWNNRGRAFADLGMWMTAEESFRQSLGVMPAIEPHMGLANMYCTLNNLKKAAEHYRAAIEHDPGFPDAHFNLGVTLLGLGKWNEGFPEYEWRWKNTPYPPRAYIEYRKWTGEDLTGKVIALYPEQGYGDEILAMRFARTVMERFPYSVVVLLARSPTLRLARSLDGEDAPLNVKHINDPNLSSLAINYSCPLLDVPMVLGMTPGQVSRPWRYLMADPAQVDRFRSQLPHDGLNVGLCWWSGGHLGTTKAAQQAKSIPAHWLKPLAMPGVNLISLQKDNRDPTPFAIDEKHIRACEDFADTAALIEALDLVISVDTSVAHLAGALGKPVWNFVRFSGYWPWLTADYFTQQRGRDESEYAIWYPTMKLLRQPSLANWHEPIERATAWLTELVGPPAPPRTIETDDWAEK